MNKATKFDSIYLLSNVNRFSRLKRTISTKYIDAYKPNQPERMLRYALNEANTAIKLACVLGQ